MLMRAAKKNRKFHLKASNFQSNTIYEPVPKSIGESHHVFKWHLHEVTFGLQFRSELIQADGKLFP